LKDSPSSATIEPILIQWGCVAKGTMVATPDGARPVEMIRIGDLVIANDKPARVTNILTGSEEQLVFAKTAGGKSIQASRTHIIHTVRGKVRAEDLNFADQLITKDGAELLTDLYLFDYGDKVYSLVFGEESVIICNGILTGDYAAQNSYAPPQVAETSPEDAMLIAEVQKLFKELGAQ
jgi:hypothetical protein